MLSKADNELLTRSGKGTAMGDLLRRFWMPALLAEELRHMRTVPPRILVMHLKSHYAGQIRAELAALAIPGELALKFGLGKRTGEAFGLAVPMTTETRRIPSRNAEAARQYPAASVWPVLMPSTVGSRSSNPLRFCWVMLL